MLPPEHLNWIKSLWPKTWFMQHNLDQTQVRHYKSKSPLLIGPRPRGSYFLASNIGFYSQCNWEFQLPLTPWPNWCDKIEFILTPYWANHERVVKSWSIFDIRNIFKSHGHLFKPNMRVRISQLCSSVALTHTHTNNRKSWLEANLLLSGGNWKIEQFCECCQPVRWNHICQ